MSEPKEKRARSRTQAPESPPPEPFSEQAEIPPATITVTERGVSTQLPSAERHVSLYRTPENKAAIIEMYLAGASLHKISDTEGFPSYGSILRWLKDDEQFRKEVEAARLIRAWHHEEEALKAADDATEKDEVPAARLKFDAHVWAAEVNNPAQYGKKTTVSGDLTRPIIFTVVTGVPVKEDEKVIELNSDGTIKGA